MSLACAVCGAELGPPVYRSAEAVSVTSLCEVRRQPTEVSFCAACGHLQTPALADVASYYDRDYKILIDDEDEDQLYRLADGRRVYRAEHQADVLLGKVLLPNGAKVLDYGSAKAATLRRLVAERPDLVPYVFDVSDMYRRFWARFVPEPNQATYVLPAEWRGRFDLVTAFYSFEHLPNPRSAAAEVHACLAPGGTFYGIVPSWTANVADFVVVDHVQHFSPPSLRRLLADAGFGAVAIDTAAHESALVWIARKDGASERETGGDDLAELAREVSDAASYWRGFAERVRAFEREARGARVAVYGSGFYGTFVTTCLRAPERIVCYLDQNPHRQGKELLGKPIHPPAGLPADVSVVYVGLNPAHARAEIAKVTEWAGRELSFFYP